MTTSKPYVPDGETVREQYSREQPPHIGTVAEKHAEFDRFIAQVKRDAARDALYGLALDAQEDYQIAAQGNDQERMDADVAVMDAALAWKDNYPEDVTP